MADEFNTKVMPDGKIVCTEKSSTLEQVFAALMNGNGWVGDAEEALENLLLRYVAIAFRAELMFMPERERIGDEFGEVVGVNTYVTFQRYGFGSGVKPQMSGDSLELKFTTPLRELLSELADDDDGEGKSVFRKMLDAAGLGEASS